MDDDAGAPGDVDVVAHRGFAGVYPENTQVAVRRAVAAGADAVEVDVMPCADGEVVVVHDATPDRVTDAGGATAERAVWETPLADLRELRVLGTGERVPLLSEVVDAVPAGVTLHVEFKNPGTADVRPGEHLSAGDLDERRATWRPFAERALAVLADAACDVVVSSFCEAALAAVRDLDPSVPLAAVAGPSVPEAMDVARRHDCAGLHLPRNAVPGTALYGSDYAGGPYDCPDVLADARAADLAVRAWTVETWHQAAELRRTGVDAVIADYPGLCWTTAEVPREPTRDRTATGVDEDEGSADD